jgi:2-polyprenyl-3-methyl-5-hydroxy-6-metoxy-1,4-benzoquinol methylase
MPKPGSGGVTAGHYAQKQLLSRSRLVRWSHGGRFAMAQSLVAPFAGRLLLDYGCGDGTFLSIVHGQFPQAVGVDIAADQIDDCRQRFSNLPGISFLTTDRLNNPEHHGRYDVVVCMEVLEHCPDDVQGVVLDRIASVIAPGGTLVISVPIEIGAPLIAKQTARALMAVTGMSEYSHRERYRAGELARMVFADEHTAIPRPEYEGASSRFTGHKGFNWRRLERAIEQRFAIDRRLFSPMPMLGSWLNSQVWFVCRTR